jgi:hypothetical protein
MFMTLLVNILWMLFMLLFAVLCFGNSRSYKATLEQIDIPEAA